MIKNGKWIWLSDDKFSNYQETVHTCYVNEDVPRNYCMAEFKREYIFEKKIVNVELEVCADTNYLLWLNSTYIGRGAICPGGDYGFTGTMPYAYSNYYTFNPDSCSLSVFARVQLSPVVQCDVSWGHGGFILGGVIYFEDGTYLDFGTDKTWALQ